MATIQFRPGSVLGLLLARDRTARPGKAKGQPSRFRRLVTALVVVLGPLLVPAAGLAAITIGAWQWATPAGLIMLGVSLLVLDASAGTRGPTR